MQIPASFKTTNGYEYDDNGISLGLWIGTQRRNFSNLSEEKQKKLKSIGFVLDVYETRWNYNYKLAKAYYEKNGHLQIPASFKTTNGYEYDENGIALGTWIVHQRSVFSKLEEERQEKLLKINFIINTKNHSEQIKNICLENNIDYNINKNTLSKISVQEFIAKINYLKEKNISLTKTDGNLQDIFSMASTNMKIIYGFTLEEIINTYYIKKAKEKGV